MNYLYQEMEKEGQVLDVLTDEDSGLRIMVSRKGAEIVSLTRRNRQGKWEGFLWRDGEVSAPESGWKNHSTVMGYYVHRLKEEKSQYLGHEVHGGTHGFLRHKQFAKPKISDEAGILTYHLSHQEIEKTEYPFRVSLDLTYRLHAEKLYIQFYFTNHEIQRAARVSFGLHPGFAVTSLEQSRVIFPAGSYVRYAAPGNFLSGDRQYLDLPAGEMPFSKKDLPGSYILEMKKVPVPTLLMEDPLSRRKVELDFAGVPYVTLWSDGNPFVCIEPCWGLPDHHHQKPFESKEGMQVIAPRGTITKIFSIAPKWME